MGCFPTQRSSSKRSEPFFGLDLFAFLRVLWKISQSIFAYKPRETKLWITVDALNTQKDTIGYIVDEKGYYVAPVKGNHSILEENIKLYFNDKKLFEEAKQKSYFCTTEKSHGYEKREYIFTDDVDWIYKKSEWKDLKSIGVVIRTYQNENGDTITDKRYYISNLPIDNIELISNTIRGEWKIENNLHWYLDMVFLEDNNKCYIKNTQKNLNIIRKFALFILKRFKEQSNLSMNSIRFNICMDFENEIEKIINTLYKWLFKLF